MNISVEAGVLKSALKDVAAVISNKSMLMILEDVVLTPDGNELEVKASDGELWVSRRVAMTGSADGEIFSFAIKAKDFASAVTALPDQPIVIDAHDGNAKVTHSGGSFSFPYDDPKDFPEPNRDGEDLYSFTGDASLISYALTSAMSCVGRDQLRLVLNGCCFDPQDDGLRIVSSDGHKLSKILIPNLSTDGQLKAICLPTKATSLLRNMTSKKEEGYKAYICTDGLLLNATIGRDKLVARLTEGNFPKYDNIIPSEFTCTCMVEKERLSTAVRRVAQFANQASQMVLLKISSEGLLNIEGSDSDFAKSAQETMSCEYNGDEGITIGIKATALLDVLSVIEAESVVLNMTDAQHAIVITPATDMNMALTQSMLIMPMMID